MNDATPLFPALARDNFETGNGEAGSASSATRLPAHRTKSANSGQEAIATAKNAEPAVLVGTVGSVIVAAVCSRTFTEPAQVYRFDRKP